MEQDYIDIKTLIDCILQVAPGKKITYRNYNFFICYGDSIRILNGEASGNLVHFRYSDARSFLKALCEANLRLSISEQMQVLALYHSKVIGGSKHGRHDQ
jgi:hypothetical protein